VGINGLSPPKEGQAEIEERNDDCCEEVPPARQIIIADKQRGNLKEMPS